MKPTDFAVQLSKFLTYYLPSQRNLSTNTIKAYRDTFILLLRFFRDAKGRAIERLCIEDLKADLIMEFLEDLEHERKCSILTRNSRLAAIHSFFRYLQTEEPKRIMQCQQILAIPSKKHSRRVLGYLTAEEMRTLLSQPSLNTKRGRRDAVMLSLLYDTGARVQELIDISVGDVRFEDPMQVRLTGKGHKIRVVPLMKSTAEALKEYMREHGLDKPNRTDEPLFCNRQGRRLSRPGVRHILLKYAKHARSIHPSLLEDISPHTLRHTKAMHMLQTGIPLVVIRDFLGHVDMRTSEVYARSDLDMKRQALEKVSPTVPTPVLPSWKEDKEMMEWLRSF